MEKVKPALLEPIMDVEIDAPQECSGDIMGDLNSRRGRVQGMDTRGKQQVVKAQVPMSEMLNYQSTSFHDDATLRQVLGLRPAPELEVWLEEMGLMRDGKLTEKAGDPSIFG